ncbi:MAG: hypothetical protein LLG44_11900, partial [Chloroflexi bacterium]|nr:hypothetical protein [Chloroflexota bacterium]
DWDPLRPAEGAYADAPYQTSGLRWSPDGSYLYSILDYTLGQAPAWGIMVQSAPQTVVAQRPASAHTWYIFPAWLADGRYAWLEADPVASDDYTFALTRAAVGMQAAPLEMPSVSGAAWTSDGSALALCTTDGANAAGAQVVVVELASAGEK